MILDCDVIYSILSVSLDLRVEPDLLCISPLHNTWAGAAVCLPESCCTHRLLAILQIGKTRDQPSLFKQETDDIFEIQESIYEIYNQSGWHFCSTSLKWGWQAGRLGMKAEGLQKCNPTASVLYTLSTQRN